MLTEPTEVRLSRRPADAVTPAVDEAFASVTDADLRLDTPRSGADNRPADAAAGLADSLRDQLRALERQRDELSRLLDSLGS